MWWNGNQYGRSLSDFIIAKESYHAFWCVQSIWIYLLVVAESLVKFFDAVAFNFCFHNKYVTILLKLQTDFDKLLILFMHNITRCKEMRKSIHVQRRTDLECANTDRRISVTFRNDTICCRNNLVSELIRGRGCCWSTCISLFIPHRITVK